MVSLGRVHFSTHFTTGHSVLLGGGALCETLLTYRYLIHGTVALIYVLGGGTLFA
jgi:hypothetical protein